MNEIPKNNINDIMREHKNDEDIDNLFSTILPPNQSNIFLKLFLHCKETQNRSIHSRKMFIFLLSLGKYFREGINILNYTLSFDEFLSEIQDSEYLCSNFHFISRSVQQVLQYIFINNVLESFCLISYKARLLQLECIPALPLFLNQDREAELNSNNYLFYIQCFLSRFDEKFLVWCYIENFHKEFCKLIDKRKKYVLDQFSESIIKERIEITNKMYRYDPSLFIEFLFLLYPLIQQTNPIQNELIPKSKSIEWIINPDSDKKDDNISSISQNIDQSQGFVDINPPYKNNRHAFNISRIQFKADFNEIAPQSLPPTMKKLLKVQTRPKFELKIIPSIAERFRDSNISFQSKVLAKNLEVPSNFLFKDFNTTLSKLSNIGVNGINSNQAKPFKERNYSKYPSFNRFNKILKVQPTEGQIESNKILSSIKDDKDRDNQNKLEGPNKKNAIELIGLNGEKKLRNQIPSGKKVNVIPPNSIDIKTKLKTDKINNNQSSDDYKEYSSSSESESESKSESESDDEDSDSKNSQNNIECNLSSYPSSNPPGSNKRILIRKRPSNIQPPMTNATSNTSNSHLSPQQKIQTLMNIQIQKRNASNNISIQKNSPNQITLDKQNSSKP